MTDTLRDQLTRELRRKVIFITPQEQEVFLAYEKLADAAIAFIAAWALEPAQVEKAAKAHCKATCVQLRRWNPAGYSPTCEECGDWENGVEPQSAAIAALFKHRKDTMR